MYGAKEWDGNLSLYDFSARWYNPMGAVSFTTMDPLCEKYYWISPYAYCAGNPVNLVDPDGIEFTKRSQQYLDLYLDQINKSLSNALEKSIEYKQQLMDESLSQFKRKRIERKREKQNEIMEEMAAASLEYLVLKESSQMYDVSIDDSIMKLGDDDTTIHGVTVFDTESSTVLVKMYQFSLATIAHELKHAFQFESGETAFRIEDGYGSIHFHDFNDEKEAFARGSFWGGESMPYDFYSHLYRDNRAISVGSSPAAVQRTANRLNIIIRFNGVTYYGESNDERKQYR